MKAIPFVLFILLGTVLSPAGAQEMPSGRVTDPRGEPIAGARIAGADGSLIAVSGRDGRFSLIEPGTLPAAIEASAEGFESVRLVIGATGATDDFDIVLERSPYRLPAVSVTGSSRPEIAAIPGAVSVVGRSVLRDRAPISVMDALRTVPGVQTADEDPFGLNLNIGFRGLPPRRSSRTLLLEDGVPILLGPYGDPSMHYAPPVAALERIEIMKGSSQIMQGPQTVGGVINFVTRRPPREGTFGDVTVGAGALGYRNANVWLGSGRAGSGVALDYTHRQGEGVRREQGHEVHNALLSTIIQLSVNQTLLVKSSLWNESSRISETGLTQSEFEADPFSLPFSAAGRFDVRRYAGQVVHELRRASVRLQTNAYFTHTNRASWRQSSESGERLGRSGYAEDFACAADAVSYEECGNQGRPRKYTVAGVEPRVSIEIGDGDTGATVDVGLRLYRENVRRRQYLGRTPTSRVHDAELTRDNQIETDVFAGFLHARLRRGAATLSPGVRIERLAQDVRNRFPGSEASVGPHYTQLLPGLGAAYSLEGGTSLFMAVHRGFAPPRPADVYHAEPGQPIVLVNPETSWNWELGGRFEPGTGVAAEATLFRMGFRNQIIEAPATAGQRFTNGGRTLHQGVEMAGHVSLGALSRMRDDLTLTATYTYLGTARFESGDRRGGEIQGNRLPYAPRHLASGSATFGHRSGVSIGASLESTAAQFSDEENTIEPSDDGQSGILPAYTVAHMFASYSIRRTNLQLRASVRNLLDEVYVTQRNDGIYTGMRRLARTELHWSF